MTDIVHVPYKGAGPGIADLVSGHIPMMSPNITGQLLELPQRRQDPHPGGELAERLKAAPDIPTAIEQGVPDMVGQLFLGIYSRRPARRRPIVERIAEATRKAMADAGVREGR